MIGKVSQQQGKLNRADSSSMKARELRERVLMDEVGDEVALKAMEKLFLSGQGRTEFC